MPDFDLDSALNDSSVLPDFLAAAVAEGTLEQEHARADGTVEFGVKMGLEPDSEISRVVWHPPGAEQDFEGTPVYVQTDYFRNGDLNDPLGNELVATCEDDVEYWLSGLSGRHEGGER